MISRSVFFDPEYGTADWHALPPVIRIILLAACCLCLSGCSAIPVYRQELVSSNGMIFSDSPLLQPESVLLTQMEPGVASSGGGQAAGCSSCR